MSTGATTATSATTERARIESLGDVECLELLTRAPVGRLGFSAGALPVILPVNFVLDGDRAVFATEPGAKLDAARAAAVACLEVDGFDTLEHGGWSVLATGRLSLLRGTSAALAARLPLSPWAIAGAPRHFVELSIELLSGRRIALP